MIMGAFGFVLAASIGALLRYRAIAHLNLYWGTLLVNVVGSIAIGFLAVYLEKTHPQLKVVVLVAFLGSLTTFSSYSLDVIKLFEEGQLYKAAFYITASNLLCLMGCFAGWKVAQFA